MRYTLVVCQDESTMGDVEEMRTDPEGFAWFEEMDRQGLLRGGARLRPSGDATTVRVRDKELLLSDSYCSRTAPSQSPRSRWAATT